MDALDNENNNEEKEEKEENEEDEENEENDVLKENGIKLINSETSKKKRRLPLLLYIFFFSVLILFVSLIILLAFFIYYKESKYSFDIDPYEKPKLTNYTYENITFNNGLQVLLIQIPMNNSAGGAIVFDTGYLDTNFQDNNLSCAAYSLYYQGNIENSNQVNYSMGEFKYSVEEFYTSFQFKTMNDNFFDFLFDFKNLTEIMEENFIDSKINEALRKLEQDFGYKRGFTKKKENHLLEFLVYGYKDNKANDVQRESRRRVDNNIDIPTIRDNVNKLLEPSKVKIVLMSKHKLSWTKKYMLKYFQNIINREKNSNDFNKSINGKNNFTTHKIISMAIDGNESNYINIIYYINKTDKESDLDFYIKYKYFNYLKYILEETNEHSLYYNLTNSKDFNIKSLYCGFDIIFTNTIKFDITIELTLTSYLNNGIEKIINNVYSYINKIVNHVLNMNENDERYKELQIILKQNFTFTEDSDNVVIFSKKKGIDIIHKNCYNYFLKENWIPDLNLNDMKKLFRQLNPKNSVVIFGYNYNKTQQKEFSKEFQKLFKTKNYKILYYKICRK